MDGVLMRLLVLMIMVLVVGCDGGGETAENGGRLQVVATIGMISDVVKEVSGGQVDVRGLIGSGVDPHLYKPTAQDVKWLQSADVVFFNGLKLEGKMSDVLDRLEKQGKEVYAISGALSQREGYVIDDGDGHLDPHIWMDVTGWMEAAKVVGEVLTQVDPEHRTEYAANLDGYLAKLKELDDYCRKSLATIPDGQRILVTAHDAFHYLGRAYGLEVRGIQGLSTESEAGVREIEELVDYLVTLRIPSVFVESSVSDKNVRALVEGAAARGHQVVIGAELFSDAMGPQGTYEGTYVGMIDHNITMLTRALGGVAPERGFQGKLSPGPMKH